MFGKGKPPPSSVLADRMRKAVERSVSPAPLTQRPRTERSVRQPVYRQGMLILAEGERLSVAIKDLSEGGARVEYFVRRELPDFVVLIEPTLRIRRRARVVWRRDGAAGLAFEPDEKERLD